MGGGRRRDRHQTWREAAGSRCGRTRRPTRRRGCCVFKAPRTYTLVRGALVSPLRRSGHGSGLYWHPAVGCGALPSPCECTTPKRNQFVTRFRVCFADVFHIQSHSRCFAGCFSRVSRMGRSQSFADVHVRCGMFRDVSRVGRAPLSLAHEHGVGGGFQAVNTHTHPSRIR